MEVKIFIYHDGVFKIRKLENSGFVHVITMIINIVGNAFSLFQILTETQQITVRILYQQLPLTGSRLAGVVKVIA